MQYLYLNILQKLLFCIKRLHTLWMQRNLAHFADVYCSRRTLAAPRIWLVPFSSPMLGSIVANCKCSWATGLHSWPRFLFWLSIFSHSANCNMSYEFHQCCIFFGPPIQPPCTNSLRIYTPGENWPPPFL